ncbi:MAG: hypothetical protein LBR52_03370 [Prevotellaceae bacterium]|jgi:hypothetical protein|nr:hypothetical protein [Prevotellaceae bacterium]
MRNILKQTAILLSVFTNCLLSVSAQQAETDTTIARNIEIVKEYNPVIQEAGKINIMPELKDIEAKKIQTNFAVRTNPFSPKTDAIPSLDYATVAPQPAPDYKNGFVKAGGGNYTSFLGELYTPFHKTQQNLLDFYLKHNSSFGDVKLTPEMYPSLTEPVNSQALTNDNKARLSFSRNVRNKEFSTFISGGYNRFDYYGFDVPIVNEDYRKQAFTNFDVNLRYRTKDYISKWKYDLQTNYQLFQNRNKLAEHTIYTDVMGNYRMESSSLGARLEMYNIFLNKPENTALYNFKDAGNTKDYTVLKLNPYYTLEGKLGTMVIGIKGAFSIGQGRPGAISPDIYGNVKIIDRKLYIYAGVTGDLQVNNYRYATLLNPYISPDVRIEDTYTPIDVYAGTKIRFFNKVNADFFLGYKIINNPYFFVNRIDGQEGMADVIQDEYYYNTFDVAYDKDAGLFNAGLTLLYNWQDKLNFTFKSKYSTWSLDEIKKPWQIPSWELDFQTSYHVTDYLRFNLAYRFEAGRYAVFFKENDYNVSMKNINDLSFGANYKLLSFADIFLNLNNLLNQEYAEWYGYTKHRFNIMGGVSVSF